MYFENKLRRTFFVVVVNERMLENFAEKILILGT